MMYLMIFFGLIAAVFAQRKHKKNVQRYLKDPLPRRK
ncbi:hypothetical protein J2125_001500 [Erwinia toletana]|uniref:Uncharacterized protein n=1 Tax=Winslowiella toletana TaxID=92490 RepID=A0ABS4P6N7_9GAMM|nr:hypothetical protein [Winslowiella toletana]